MNGERTIEAGRMRFRWLEQGDGMAVVLIHGIPTSPALWRHVVPLVSGVRTLAWEMVGYGASWEEGKHQDISVKAQAGHVARWMDAIGLDRAVFVGHDLGGGVVQNVAVRMPDRCLGLVLTDCVSHDSWPIAPVKILRAAPGLVASMPSAALRFGYRAFMRIAHQKDDMADEAMEHHWPHYDHPDGARALVRQARSLRTEDTLELVPALPGVGVPAAVVWATDDRFLPLEYGRRLAEDLDATFAEIPGGHHYTPEDHPDRIADAIRQVVERVRAGGGEQRPATA